MDFEEDIRQHVLTHLPHDPAFAAELAAKTSHQLLILYTNWLDRLIDWRPRRVHLSSVLIDNPLAADPAIKPGLDKLVVDLEAGRNVNPHLSRRTRSGFAPYDPKKPARKPSLNSRRDLDLLLYDWGIHHLHLGTILEADGFYSQGESLLFAVIRPDDAYLIDVAKHGAWVEQRMLEIIVREWPDSGIMRKVRGPSGKPLTDEQRRVLRSKASSAMFELDGEPYQPLGGLMANGTGLCNLMLADRLWNDMEIYRAKFAESPEFLRDWIEARGVLYPADPDWHFAFFDEGYGLEERKTGFKCRIVFRQSDQMGTICDG